MANGVQILDKIQRNCQQRGISVSRTSATALIAAGITITYTAAVIDGPMGGVSDALAPFLGIGIANPGKIALSANPASLAELQVLRIVCGHANTVVIPAGELPGSSDLNGMGQ